ncbi:MAG TPA: hypothetical protein VLD83_00795 [Candidatus Binatia bacterium]|nr:hypothetical protein [Candidatus Binatia bacterium]
MKWTGLVLLLLFVTGDAEAAAAAQKPQPLFTIATRLDRTAIWVGDPVVYTIEVIHPRSVQFALDNLKKEDIALPPFVMRAIQAEEREWRDNQKLLRVVLHLTTYESGKPDLMIPPVALYYFKRDSALTDKEARAQAIRIPAQRIALRSTLSTGQNRLREFKEIRPVEITLAIGALVLGLIGMGFVMSRAAVRLWGVVHRDKAVKRPVSRRVRQRWVHEGLQRIRKMADDTTQEPKTFYAEISQFLRQYLTEWLAVEARGLTPMEAQEALLTAGYNGSFAQQVRTVLEQCEEAQYGKRDGGSAEDGRPKAALLDALEQAIKTTPRAR